MKKLASPYKYLGQDDWSRDLFETNTGVTLVDVDGELYTTTDSWGEPCDPTGIETPKVKEVTA